MKSNRRLRTVKSDLNGLSNDHVRVRVFETLSVFICTLHGQLLLRFDFFFKFYIRSNNIPLKRNIRLNVNEITESYIEQ